MEMYVPDMYKKSIYDINYDVLKEKGIKCLLFDLDNTLVPYNIKEINDKLSKLFAELKQNFKIIIFSNSPIARVKFFKEALEVDGVGFAKKPRRKNFQNILNKYKLEEDEVAIIGDQLNTDIIGGNKVGITTILINPVSKKDPFWVKPERFYERRIMKKLKDHDLFFKGRYYE